MSYLNGRIVATDECAREARQPRLIRAQMSSKRLPLQEIIIRNISCSGIGAASRGLPPIRGEEIKISLSHSEDASGIVSWVNGLSFGVKLDQELDLEALVATMQRLQEIRNVSADWEVRRHHQAAPTASALNLRRV